MFADQKRKFEELRPILDELSGCLDGTNIDEVSQLISTNLMDQLWKEGGADDGSQEVILESLFGFIEFLHFFNEKVKKQVPITESDIVKWPFVDGVIMNYPSCPINYSMSLRDFLLLFTNAPQITVNALHQ